MDSSNISHHMSKKLQTLLPKFSGSHASLPGDPPAIDLSVAENDLLREEILALFKESINNDLKPKDLSYPVGFGGDPELLDALAGFFNAYFHPSSRIEPNHIVTTSGAGNALDALLCSVCDQGDSVLVAGPCWEGFAPYFLIHANVEPIVVNTPAFEGATGFDVVEALKKAYHDAAEPKRIKAMIFTNPSNPLGRCYPPEVLRECLCFCNAHEMHFISDEVYALSSFESPANSPPFVSALSLLDKNLSTDIGALTDRVHVVWSMSKDFGCSGIRMGCIISQSNQLLRIGSALASYWQASSLTSVVAKSFLKSPQLPAMIKLNSERLGHAYRLLTEGLIALGVKFIPANYGLFVFARLAEHAGSWDDEAAAVKQLIENGLVVAAGQKFAPNASEMGWVRITFSTSAENIEGALRSIEKYLAEYRSIANEEGSVKAS